MIIYILAGTAPGFTFLASNAVESGYSLLAFYQKISATLIWPTFFVLLYLFPDGRFVPRWTRFLAPLPYIEFILVWWIDPKSFFVTLLQWTAIMFAAGGIASQVYRYRRTSNPSQRQQTKWVVFALGVLVVSLFINQATISLDPTITIGTVKRFLFDLYGNYVFGVIMATLIPLSMGISILRYRLWDIDLIIRRTLLYTLLSGSLGVVYFGSVIVLRQVSGIFTGESSAALVISTLLIAALFTPLRRGLQTAIDRRFYRQKYDLAQSLERFSTVARNEVELAALSESLASVVTTALQPQSFSLWIKPPLPNGMAGQTGVGDPSTIGRVMQESPSRITRLLI
ncbi:MAG TPA: hypothetical protein PJ988_00455 [Anaerolinea sp.]|nr:hypothetical protein [Anaerolinea sp.]